MSVHLHGLGHFHPPNEISNTFLENLDIGTSDAWILERVGIRSRRTVLSLDYIRETKNADPRASFDAANFTQAQMGAHAARMAIERAGVSLGDIGMIIGGSSAPDFVSPAQSCAVAAELGIDVPAFDISSACTSFFVPLYLLSMMDASRLPRFILLVVPETLTRTVDYRDRTAAVLWGDAAVAAVLSLSEPGRAEVLGNVVGSTPTAFDKVVIPRMGFFRQDGQSVQKFAIKSMISLVRALQREYFVAGRQLGFVGHQANLRMLERVCESCEIPSARHFHNLIEFGNTAAAGSPSVLSQRWDEWNSHDDVALAGVGAGLTWSSYLLRFLR